MGENQELFQEDEMYSPTSFLTSGVIIDRIKLYQGVKKACFEALSAFLYLLTLRRSRFCGFPETPASHTLVGAPGIRF
jgi:hypothetical protein